ncbi:hypothetical protein ScPMuIL_016410 [Solemya velum]
MTPHAQIPAAFSSRTRLFCQSKNAPFCTWRLIINGFNNLRRSSSNCYFYHYKRRFYPVQLKPQTMQSALIASRRASASLLEAASACVSCLHLTQTRNTVIVERKYPVNLHNKGSHPRLKAKNYIYKVVDYKNSRPVPNIDCLLTDYVEGIGVAGEIVNVKRRLFRNRLYPAGLAVYPTEEALEDMAEIREAMKAEDNRLSQYAKMTVRQLAGLHMRIPMSGDNLWVLNKTHIRVALRKMGVEVKEDCITLPTEPVTEPQEVEIGLSINNAVDVKVRGTIYHIFKDRSRNVLPENLPKVWKNPPVDN